MSGHRIGKDLMLAATTKALEKLDPGDAGTIKCTESPQVVGLKSSGAETRTLADPDGPGQILIMSFVTDGGDVTVTADTAINQDGNNTMTWADAGDIQVLVSVEISAGTYAWREIANDGVALTTV